MTFAYFAIVRAKRAEEPAHAPIVGREGAVLGISSEQEGNVLADAVFIYDRDEIRMLLPSELEN